jgi:hypothetical protein
MYSHDESLAMKAASNEIRSMNSVIELNIPHLHLTLTAMFYIQGHAVIATALAPLKGEQTLSYGSSDGGWTMKKKKNKLNDMMEEMGRLLNLKKHVVIAREEKKGYEMSVAADVEAHVGEDGLYYVLDIARLMPPRFHVLLD